MGRILKEIFILLLLGAVILFTLSMIFYDFFDSTQELPEIREYVADSIVKTTIQEIEMNLDTSTSSDSLLKSYEIVSADLKNYTTKKSYQKGKANPFVEYKTEVQTTTSSGTTNNSVNTTTTTNTNKNTNNNTTNNNTINTNTTNTSTNQGTFFEKPNSK